jgi:anti-sigma factor RsiW
MHCRQVKELLSAYIDDMLTPEQKREVEEHLGLCPQCSQDAAFLRQCVQDINALDKVKAPDNFLGKIKARIARDSEFKRIMGGIDKPSRERIYTRVAVTLVTVVVVVVAYAIITPELGWYGVQRARVYKAANVESAKVSLSSRGELPTVRHKTAAVFSPGAPLQSLIVPSEISLDEAQESSDVKAENKVAPLGYYRAERFADNKQVLGTVSQKPFSESTVAQEMAKVKQETVDIRIAGMTAEEALAKIQGIVESVHGNITEIQRKSTNSITVILSFAVNRQQELLERLSQVGTVTSVETFAADAGKGDVTLDLHMDIK